MAVIEGSAHGDQVGSHTLAKGDDVIEGATLLGSSTEDLGGFRYLRSVVVSAKRHLEQTNAH
jgi:hypothetical protein